MNTYSYGRELGETLALDAYLCGGGGPVACCLRLRLRALSSFRLFTYTLTRRQKGQGESEHKGVVFRKKYPLLLCLLCCLIASFTPQVLADFFDASGKVFITRTLLLCLLHPVQRLLQVNLGAAAAFRVGIPS